MAKTFNELTVYQLGVELDKLVWALRRGIQPSSPGLWDQVDRSSGSITDNIAEGFGRETRADFRNYLRYSRGSAHEVESQIERAANRELISDSDAQRIIALAKDLSVRLKNFQEYLKRAPKSSSPYEAREPITPYLAAHEVEAAKDTPDWWASTEESEYPDEYFDVR